MIFLRFSGTVIGANTYVLADADAKVALVVDTGAGAATWVPSALEKRGLTLGAVLLTHGHADHVWDCAEVAGDAPVFIPSEDLFRLDDPLATTGLEQLAPLFSAVGSASWVRPRDVRALPEEFYDASTEIVDGISLRALAAPGHSQGSTVFLFDGYVDPGDSLPLAAGQGGHMMLSGDVLFNNGIGRTDLPGSDPRAMEKSLRRIAADVDEETWVFPGHGPATKLSRELNSNPYFRMFLE
ncbi:MBL fold metallo-hydrolase [Arcanobacterium canis]